ncbi:MAG TPA: hypothetical protein VK588_01955 [Chitinophagaceae bacterium]|nr:hypothetical protein [Chitinophagaceae bacterium]
MTLKKIFFKITHWETWHYLAKYIPIAPVWGWYCLRAKSLWFFTPSNPTLTFGGFEGETKREMYEQLPPGSYPESLFIDHKAPFEEIEAQLGDSIINFPFAVKPDAGMMGFMFRKIRDKEELREYHQKMPVDYIIQRWIDFPLEVSVFYYRFPGQVSGTITGFIKKEFLQVVGDGSSTLGMLIDNYPRATYRLDEVRAKHADKLDHIIPAGQPYVLSYALNLSRGGKLISLEHEKDENLLKVFDGISQYANQFYYGRYDIKCASVESLKQGKDFSILEYNGCGAEPHHIYGNGNTLIRAYAIVLKHWKVLYKISSMNHRNGICYWSYRRGSKFLLEAKKNFRILKRLDRATSV